MSDEQAQQDTPRLRLRSLKVHQFRDVKPGTELTFGDGFHLILGKNATGKSTLLELLAAVSTLNFSGEFFAETPFDLEASFEVGRVSLHAELRRAFEPSRIETAEDRVLDSSLGEDAETLVRVEHQGVPLRQWVQVRTGESLAVYDTDPRTDAQVTGWTTDSGRSDPLKLSVGRVLSDGATVDVNGALRVHPAALAAWHRSHEFPGTGAPFDEALGALQTMTGSGLTLKRGKRRRHESPWLPPVLRFDAQGEPVTCDLLKDPLLKNVVEQLACDDAKAYFGPAASVQDGWLYSSPSFQFFRRGKAVRRHDQLSFGQQRLFSFAWYLACNPDVAIADELVNGLHADWIDWCVDALRDRQSFLTSQNPILVDAMPFENQEDVARGIILCSSTRDEASDTTELSWRQLDEREAKLIGGALQRSRIDLLSDLLHALDLW